MNDDDDKETLSFLNCGLVKDVEPVECEGGCGELILRPIEAPEEAEALCPQCYREAMADAAEAGLEVNEHTISINPTDH